MTTVVVPFRGADGKRRLAPLPDAARAVLAHAMLADVLAACAAVGPAVVVAPATARAAVECEATAEFVVDPGGGQGEAVAAALARAPDAPVLVVNADLPCATPGDLEALLAPLAHGSSLALVEAHDGTTNALGLASPALFRPCFGPGSAARFRALGNAAGGATVVAAANLVDDVDTLDDLRRLAGRLGPRTAEALAALDLLTGAAA